MNWIFYFVATAIFIFVMPNQASAQIYKLNSEYNVRSSPNFELGTPNILGSLKPGSKIKVLETKTMPSGVNAFRIEILATNSFIKTSKTKQIWIRKSVDKDYVKTESGACKDCGEPAIKLPAASQNNVKDLSDVARHFEDHLPGDVAQETELPLIDLSKKDSSFDKKIENYSNSGAVKKMIAYGKKIKSTYGQGSCYHDVKTILRKGGLIGDIGTIPAIYAKEDLKKFGFKNLLEIEPYSKTLKSPSDAPKGAVLVYSSGYSCIGSDGKTYLDCGHVEIKIGEPKEPGYISDYKSSDAINETAGRKKNGSNYKLIGVMVKPMEDI